ncbi:hypothetical protein Mterra_01582 [Calidithermus terrae]|uniref:Uncharacterized protein n=1 Tax=Calidithermus terrae TaxID=1408545 RepID=A0A399ES85_9DEIN|nr:hypothetical protein [Calidithermus terrae]RIH85919.1 hypothetical protein Mterra_01582 [Calidithermus terrae]
MLVSIGPDLEAFGNFNDKAADDSGIASVSLYARAPRSPNQGQILGSTAEASGEGLYTLSVSTAVLLHKAALAGYYR